MAWQGKTGSSQCKVRSQISSHGSHFFQGFRFVFRVLCAYQRIKNVDFIQLWKLVSQITARGLEILNCMCNHFVNPSLFLGGRLSS